MTEPHEDREYNRGPEARKSRRPEHFVTAGVSTLITAVITSIVGVKTNDTTSARLETKFDATATRLESKLDATSHEIADFKGDVRTQIAEIKGQMAGANDLKAIVVKLEERLHTLELKNNK